jgi:hypothetical protein
MRRYLALVREALSLATAAPVSAAAHIAGSVVEVAVVAAALRAMLGLGYASSVAIAMIVSSPAAAYARVFGFPQNLIPEASLPPSALRRLETLVQLLVGAVLSPLYVLALTAAAAALGVAHWGALNPLYIVALSIPPMLNRSGVSGLLEYLRAVAMKRLRVSYYMWGPPATPREFAGAFFEILWSRVVYGVVFTVLTPVYYSMSALSPWLQALAAVLNPYALCIETARSILASGYAPPATLIALAALSAFWLGVRMALARYVWGIYG